MDIFSHAIAGACTGMYFGRPVLGAVIAVLPDLPIFGARTHNPPWLYKFTHSFAFLILGTLTGMLVEMPFLVFFCLMSHLILDVGTHGSNWYPRLFWPIEYRVYRANEWEFFNSAWWSGAFITLIWSDVWLFIL
jgi:hypothetical protein